MKRVLPNIGLQFGERLDGESMWIRSGRGDLGEGRILLHLKASNLTFEGVSAGGYI